MSAKKSWTEKQRAWEAKRRERLAKVLLSPPEPATIRQVVKIPCVAVIMGAKGEGKSVLAHKIMEDLHKRGMGAAILLPPKFLHIKPILRKLVPAWVKICTSLSELPYDAVVVADEASQTAHARRTQSAASVSLDNLVGISRQRRQVILFLSHHSRKLDPNLLHESDLIIWKKPTWAHALFERDEISIFTYKALDFFEGIHGELKKKKAAIVMDFHNLRFLSITNTLPSYWSEELSELFRQFSERR